MDVTIGRILHYRLTVADVTAITRRRTTGESIAKRLAGRTWPEGAQAHIGNPVLTSQVFPMIVVAVQRTPDQTFVNGQVFLDGTDVLWVHSVEEGVEDGNWAWPVKA